jgi:ADP-ribosylglycohydrolase
MDRGAPSIDDDRLRGVLLGCALGDALGLVMEGLSARVILRRFGDHPEDRFRLLGRTGFVSDDTEQSALVAQSILRAPGDAEACAGAFRRSLAGWILRLPWGLGLATLRAGGKALVGLRRTGVRSAGNGAAMRAGPIGVYFAHLPGARRRFGRAVAEVTHLDPRGVEAALFSAEVAAGCARAGPGADRRSILAAARVAVQSDQLLAGIDRGLALAQTGVDPSEAGRELGNSGFAVHTVSLATWAFARPAASPLATLSAVIRAGGDTDSIGAIVGAWLGALVGESGLPADRLALLQRGPYGAAHLRALGDALGRAARGEPFTVPRFSAVAALLRNLALYPVVLAHGLRRLIPI